MKSCDLVQWYTAASGGIRTYIDEKRRYLREQTADEHVLIIPGRRDRLREAGRLRVYELAAPRVAGCGAYRFMWRPGRVAEILHRERPALIEVGSPYLLPWLALRHRRKHACAVTCYYHAALAADRREIGAAARAWVAERYSWEAVFERTFRLYRRLAARRQAMGVPAARGGAETGRGRGGVREHVLLGS